MRRQLRVRMETAVEDKNRSEEEVKGREGGVRRWGERSEEVG